MKKTALLLIVTLLSLLSRAQENLIFTSYSANHGLKAKNTMDILQDHKGMMWLATWDGLYKFDGYTFYNYKSKPGDGVTLSSNRFDRLQEGTDGTIWIRGYDDQTYAFSPTFARFLSLPVACYGTTSFFAELEKSSAKQRERIEEAREEKRTEKKAADKKAEKELQSYAKSSADTKRTVVQADSMEELIKKIGTVDWENVKAEKTPENGSRFDYSI